MAPAASHPRRARRIQAPAGPRGARVPTPPARPLPPARARACRPREPGAVRLGGGARAHGAPAPGAARPGSFPAEPGPGHDGGGGRARAARGRGSAEPRRAAAAGRGGGGAKAEASARCCCWPRSGTIPMTCGRRWRRRASPATHPLPESASSGRRSSRALLVSVRPPLPAPVSAFRNSSGLWRGVMRAIHLPGAGRAENLLSFSSAGGGAGCGPPPHRPSLPTSPQSRPC